MLIDLTQYLKSWFDTNKIDYFFRQNRNPYKVWVSEVVLQQTRINAALAPLQSFLEKYPTIQDLANSTEEAVLEAFQGLGYYNRATNLRAGAQYICNDLGGVFPNNYNELLKVPSIGPYTAGAIASICYGEQVMALDGNIKRVTSRIFANEDVDSHLFTNFLQVYFQSVFSINREIYPGDLNEAFMELGQRICLPKAPKCAECPISNFCVAHKNNVPENYPKAKETVEKKS